RRPSNRRGAIRQGPGSKGGTWLGFAPSGIAGSGGRLAARTAGIRDSELADIFALALPLPFGLAGAVAVDQRSGLDEALADHLVARARRALRSVARRRLRGGGRRESESQD